jgi:hypothetical protein
MSFNPLDAFTKKVADMADQPSGTPSEIKAAFDAAPEELREYFNNLVNALKSTASGDSGAKNTGATAISGLTGTDVQSLLEGLKSYIDTNATGAFFGDSNGGSIAYNSGFQPLSLATVREMNSDLFMQNGTNNIQVKKSGVYSVDINIQRSDVTAGQTFVLGFNDGTKNYEVQMIMGATSWNSASGPNLTRVPFQFNYATRINANANIYFYINTPDGPRSYWYNYRVIRISD